jgi:hypothetical protein
MIGSLTPLLKEHTGVEIHDLRAIKIYCAGVFHLFLGLKGQRARS